jgi:soluble lytic murein transglycosylase-like protein
VPITPLLAFAAFATISTSAAAEEPPTPSALVAALRQEADAYENGNGVPKDGPRAAALYCRAARLGDADSQVALGWMYAYGRGVQRDDGLAAFFFRRAADQGIEQAKNMLQHLGEPAAELPECMVEPVAPKAETATLVASEREPAEAPPWAPAPIVELVKRIAPQYRVPLPLVFAVMEAESRFNSLAVSARNAEGLMQLVPETSERFGVKNPFDPAQNIRGGVAYLRWLLAYFEGDVSLVAAAYNAGEHTVERYLGVPPYAETRAYVSRIVSTVGSTPQPFDAAVVEPSPQLRQIRKRQQAR